MLGMLVNEPDNYIHIFRDGKIVSILKSSVFLVSLLFVAV